jgi:hypothetical protein
MKFAAQYDRDNPWEGTATELLTKLNDLVTDEDMKRAREWPKSAGALTGQLNALVPDLLESGISVSSTRTKAKRILRVFTMAAQ